MARDWNEALGVKGAAWNVPAAETQELLTLTTTAASALDAAKSETTRTPVATARCGAAFDKLSEKMRDIKKRYFYMPPLEDEDFAALGLAPHDTTHTPSEAPTAQVTVETYLVGRHELGVKIVYIAGTPSDPANKGYRVWYAVVDHGETPPATPDGLPESFFTKRKNDVVHFKYEDSGKAAYFAVQIENSGGKKGPWGPMVSAVIP
jgi:hypothetical protein